MENEIIYISVNNWSCGVDYPEVGFFKDNYDQKCDGWLDLFTDEYCKENKLCVNFCPFDMSQNFTISAPKSWVMSNCPEMIEDEKNKENFTYSNPGKDRLGCEILEYKEENIGLKMSDDPYWEIEGNEDNEED